MSDVVDEKEFLDACEQGHMDVIDRLIGKVDINCRYRGKSGLMLVCINDKPWVIDVVQKLLAHGIDVDLENSTYNAIRCILGKTKFNKELAALLLYCSKLGVNKIDDNGYNYLWSCFTEESLSFLI